MARGTYGGVDFRELRSPFTTKTELLSQFINKQVMLGRPEFWYQFHNTAHGRLSLVTIRSVSYDHINRSSTCKSQHNLPLPTAVETDPVAVELPFPCSFYRSLPIVPNGSTFTIIYGNMTSLRLDSVQVNAIVHSITNMKLQSMCRSKTQLDTIMAGGPLVPGQIQAFLENLKVEKVENMTAASSYGDKVKACGVHFS